MDVREKLALSVCNATQKTNYKCDFNCEKKGKCAYCLVMAEQMISNGATVQECRVGDTIYEADGEHGVIKHEVYEVAIVFKTTATDDNGNKWDDYWTSEDIGSA